MSVTRSLISISRLVFRVCGMGEYKACGSDEREVLPNLRAGDHNRFGPLIETVIELAEMPP